MTSVGLDAGKAYKPLDVGNGIVSGSVAPNGRWLSLGIAHPLHGRVELMSVAPFAGDPFDQAAVRAYRARLADPRRETFGLDVLDAEPSSVWLEADSFPSAAIDGPSVRLGTVTFAPTGRSGAVQVLRVTARSEMVGLTWSGPMRLGRASYTQLTQGGLLPPAKSDNVTRHLDSQAVTVIDDRLLGAAAAIAHSAARLDLGREAVIVVAIALDADPSSAVAEALDLRERGPALLDRELETRRRIWTGLGPAQPEERRALAYGLDCAVSQQGALAAILADHQILPLVWTRDAYYVCRLLLSADDERARAIVDGFVRWLFERAERVDGWWPRASLASGQVKDPAFQLDQQLWPLLLVSDLRRLAGTTRYLDACVEIVRSLLDLRSDFGLIPTAETPADDPLAQPYHFSSHVLLWRVLDAFGHPAAAEVREASLRHFASEGRFAYAVAGADGAGARHYHDANDFPTVFAPGWGFCAVDDPRWRGTIHFAWSSANEGYFAGALGGLGSLHTPQPWPLGDLQEIVVARVTADPERERRARDRLARVETWDGLLPEAYDRTTGAVASRHWFAWPVALRGLLYRDPMLTAP